ncbi:hypothetical protein C2G38_2245343 [Gigaspora rosea]|uniref:Chitin-binding type-4 domain-containing protein n=1 Tax=Gigaspora rosea TaxID=44941 RepID=A0A397VBN2_9GLOM|nr:hypothetical protein C2G38_2245343 [Gigaspora rosea]CAG8528780.1 5566_t:CDS:2 [Gigaspora rosea]
MHIKKTHGCHPSGSGCEDRSNYFCGARVVYANLLPNSKINITVESPNYHNNLGISAIGHFTVHTDDNKEGHGASDTLIYDPIFVNGCTCHGCENIPLQYNFLWNLNLEPPPKGTWFDVWISIYWNCYKDGLSKARPCNSEDVHYRTYVK